MQLVGIVLMTFEWRITLSAPKRDWYWYDAACDFSHERTNDRRFVVGNKIHSEVSLYPTLSTGVRINLKVTTVITTHLLIKFNNIMQCIFCETYVNVGQTPVSCNC